MGKPRLAVFKFASCDGCQLSLLDCEDELLHVAELVDIVHFPEASRRMLPGPYDIALIEGSITTEHDVERIVEIREASDLVVSIGACATAGGIQALRNFADVDHYTRLVYPQPAYIDTLATSTPICDHIAVDFELQGCPISKQQLLSAIVDFANGRRPRVHRDSVCMECKSAGNVCIMVTRGEPCLGPVTQAGCGALCPSWNRGCYGCFGVKEQPQVQALFGHLRDAHGLAMRELRLMTRTFNAGAPELQLIARESSSGAPVEGD